MPKKFISTELAGFWTAYFNSQFADDKFVRIHDLFQPIIRKIAYRLNASYADQLASEGNIGLFKAARNFSPQENPNRFYSYALQSIRNAMIDFKRTRLNKPNAEDLDDLAEESMPTEKPTFAYTSTLSWTPTASGAYDGIQAACPGYVVTTSHPVAISYLIDKQDPEKIDLTPTEIKMADLYFHGYKTREIAEIFSLSPKQVRDRVKKIKAKIQQAYK